MKSWQIDKTSSYYKDIRILVAVICILTISYIKHDVGTRQVLRDAISARIIPHSNIPTIGKMGKVISSGG